MQVTARTAGREGGPDMEQTIAVIGAAAIGDYLFHVEHLPDRGEIVRITEHSGALVPGGCAPNIACGIAALGRARPRLFYPVGDDFSATGLLEQWQARGIDCSGLTVVPGVPSGCAWMYMQADGTTMCFSYYGAAASARAALPVELPEWVVLAPVLGDYTAGYLTEALRQRRKVVVTGIGKAALGPWLPELYGLIINRREAQELCQALDLPDRRALSEAYPHLLLYITDGGEGSSLYRAGAETKFSPVQAGQLMDFTGAGDSFTAGVVSALAAGIPPERAAWYGASMASFVIERQGGQCPMPTWEEIGARLDCQFPQLRKEEMK